MITRRGLLGATAGMAGTAALAGCSGGGGPTSGPGGASSIPARADGLPDLTWKGTITTGVQGYTPAVEGVRLAPGDAQLTQFGKAAEEFSKLYPDIKIQFLGSEYTYEPDQMTTAATGGQLPDIWWQQDGLVRTSMPQGVATNLVPYLEQPNPFIEGNTRWRDVYSASVDTLMAVDDETVYTNNGDFVSTAWFYNEQTFADAGITSTPTTFAELMDLCENLKTKGMTPFAYSSGIGWFEPIFLGNALGLETLQKIEGFSDTPGISVNDSAVAWHKGITDPRQNPAVLGWWPVAKELLAYADQTILQLPASPPPGSPDPGTFFAADRVAMIYDGTWAPNAVKDNGSDFSVGSFSWPSMVGSYEFATDWDASRAVGGPAAAWQFHISTERSDSSLREAGKLDAVVTWMKFFSTPTWNEAICNERGAFMPTFADTTPSPAFADLAEVVDNPIYSISAGASFSAETSAQLVQLFQSYVLGQTSLDEVATAYPAAVDKGLQEYLRTNPIDFDSIPS